MARVFVSHASEDIALACELHRWLVEAGHEVFLDRDLRDSIAVGEQRLNSSPSCCDLLPRTLKRRCCSW